MYNYMGKVCELEIGCLSIYELAHLQNAHYDLVKLQVLIVCCVRDYCIH